jgi:Family of unknown function (DUF6074)
MANVVALTSSKRRLPRRYSQGAAPSLGGAIVRAFPGDRQLRVVESVAAILATVSDADAEQFMVSHLDVEWGRLEAFGVPENEIERHIFTTARAIWMRMRTIGAGVA